MGRLDAGAHPFYSQIAGLEVSAHFFIQRDGALTQYVPVALRAWHAGESRWGDQTGCNDFSVGIELEGDESNPFTPVQYKQLINLTHILQARYPAITTDRIVGHKDIAPGRKWDPGPGFDWQEFKKRVLSDKSHCDWPLVWN